MSADSADHRQLGELLVEKGVVTDAQLQLALAEQAVSGEPLGEILVRLGFSIGPTIGNALAEQHGGPLRTEYGLAMGPTHGRPTSPPTQVRRASDDNRLQTADLSHEQSTSIARLTAALDERTLELERIRSELGAAQQHRLKLAATSGDREALLDKLRHAVDDQTRAEQSLDLDRTQHTAELETAAAELARANRENTEHTTRIRELEQQLTDTRTQHAELSKTIPAQRELELTLQQHKAQLANLEAQLARANRENTEHTTRIRELEQQLTDTRTQHAELSKTIPAQRELELTLQQHKAQLANLEAQLARANRENTEHTTRIRELEQQLTDTRTQHAELSKTIPAQRELELTLQQHKAQLANLEAQLARADEERTRSAALAHERKEQLEQPRAQASHERQQLADRTKALEHQLAQSNRKDEPATRQHSLRDLELTMKQHKAELEAVAAQLAQALQDRTHQASRASDLERQLHRARLEFDDPAGEPQGEASRRALVAETRARAQRRYGPPLRTTVHGEAGQKTDELGGPTDAATHKGRPHTIRIWQLALIAALVLPALYALVARSVLVGAATFALLGVIVIATASTRGSRGSSNARLLPVDTTTTIEPPA